MQFYGERAGWRPVIAGESMLRAGDWLVVSTGVHQPRIVYPPVFRKVDTLVVTSALPWCTIPYYYSSAVPLLRRPPAQVIAVLYRATADVEPQRVPPDAPPGAGP